MLRRCATPGGRSQLRRTRFARRNGRIRPDERSRTWNSLDRFSDVESDIKRARSVTLSAYVLSERGRIVRDLLTAAQRGSSVPAAVTNSGIFSVTMAKNG